MCTFNHILQTARKNLSTAQMRRAKRRTISDAQIRFNTDVVRMMSYRWETPMDITVERIDGVKGFTYLTKAFRDKLTSMQAVEHIYSICPAS